MRSPTNSPVVAQALDALPVAAVLVGQDLGVVGVNHEFEHLTGWLRASIVGRSASTLWGPVGGDATSDLVTAVARGGAWRGDLLAYSASGHGFEVSAAFNPVDGAAPPRAIGTLIPAPGSAGANHAPQDLTDSATRLLDLVHRLSAASNERDIANLATQAARHIGLDSVAVALTTTSGLRVLATAGPELTITAGLAVNPGAAGLSPDRPDVDPTQDRIRDLFDGLPDDRQVLLFPVIRDQHLHGAVIVSDPEHDLAADPARTTQLQSIAGLVAAAHHALRSTQAARDTAERDPLSGLHNRAGFVSRLEARLGSSAPDDQTTILSAALNQFGSVNDVLGPDRADALLQVIAHRFRTVAGEQALIGRTDSDEFTVAAPVDIAAADIDSFVSSIDATIRTPVTLQGATVYPVATIAHITATTATLAAEHPAVRLLRATEQKIQAAKARRRYRFNPHGPLDPVALDTDLHHAVETGSIVAYFQPIYRLADMTLTGFEALARWNHPKHGFISPDVFIPLAEDNDLIHDIGDLIQEQSNEFLRILRRKDLTLNLNVSAKQLEQTGFAARFASAFDNDAARLASAVVEITETTLAIDRTTVARELRALRDLGVGIAIDDFGTGYSSLAQLHDVPATELKIDQAFVQHIDGDGLGMLEAIIHLAQNLHLVAIAEGVETQRQLDVLRALGCDQAQGFLFSAATPADAAQRIAATH